MHIDQVNVIEQKAWDHFFVWSRWLNVAGVTSEYKHSSVLSQNANQIDKLIEAYRI